MRVGRRKVLPAGPCDLGGDTVGEAHLTSGPVVVLRPKSPGGRAGRGINGNTIDEAELGKVQRRILLIRACETNQVVKDLSDAKGSQ